MHKELLPAGPKLSHADDFGGGGAEELQRGRARKEGNGLWLFEFKKNEKSWVMSENSQGNGWDFGSRESSWESECSTQGLGFEHNPHLVSRQSRNFGNVTFWAVGSCFTQPRLLLCGTLWIAASLGNLGKARGAPWCGWGEQPSKGPLPPGKALLGGAGACSCVFPQVSLLLELLCAFCYLEKNNAIGLAGRAALPKQTNGGHSQVSKHHFFFLKNKTKR